MTGYTVGDTLRRSRARCWSAVGTVTFSKVGAFSMCGLQVLRTMVARSARRVRKLWTGEPSSVLFLAALRAAQISIRQEERWRQAYSWAGFVLHGEWRDIHRQHQ